MSPPHSPTIESTLHRIYADIAAEPVGVGDASLLVGQVGYALFERYYERHFGLPASDRSWERLAAGLDAVQAGAVDYSFAGGMAGIAWGLLHLSNQGLLTDLADDPQELVAALDEPLFLLAMGDLTDGNFDYLHGALGVCLYFLERPRTPETDGLLAQLVAEVERLSVEKAAGTLTWQARDFDPDAPEFSYNLSLSHGTASIVAVLCLLHQRGIAQATCARLVDGALRWLWSVRNRHHRAVFPSRVYDDRRDEDSRLAWCYGDLGIAHAFRLAAQTFGNAGWQRIAERTMAQASTRRSREDTRVSDPGFCHGTAGSSHLFARFSTRDAPPVFAETARYWLETTLNRSFDPAPPDRFRSFAVPSDSDGHRSRLDVLEGEAGVGLVLLSQLGASTAWSRAVLLE